MKQKKVSRRFCKDCKLIFFPSGKFSQYCPQCLKKRKERRINKMKKTVDEKKGKRGINYKCGHQTNGVIILDENILSMSAYIQWAEVEKNLWTQKECFDCFLKKLDKIGKRRMKNG